MKVRQTRLVGVQVIEPRVFGDERGFFFESFNQQAFDDALGVHVDFSMISSQLTERSKLEISDFKVSESELARGQVAQ